MSTDYIAEEKELNQSENYNQETGRSNPNQSWGGLWGALLGIAVGSSEKGESENRRSGNPENPNRSRENNINEQVENGLSDDLLRYVADKTNNDDYLNFEKCRKNPAWFKTSEIKRIVADYYKNKIR